MIPDTMHINMSAPRDGSQTDREMMRPQSPRKKITRKDIAALFYS